MTKKYFTIQVFSSDGQTAITKRVYKSFIVTIISVVSVLFLGICVLIGFYGRVYVKAMKVKNLEERNKYLEEEFKKIEIVEKDIAEIASQREKLEIALGVKNRKSDDKKYEPEMNPKEEKIEISTEEMDYSNPEMEEFLEESKKKSMSTPNLLPVNGWITNDFDPTHKAVDIAAPKGTPILSSMDGEVTFANWDSIFGNTIKITGESDYTTLYGHCCKIFVRKGDFVRKGEIIGSVGQTGKANAPHLHYEIEISGVKVNPELYFIKPINK
jgi:murein DD-endopeptidase MepM/ murein hydrolase activator NlpD